MSDFPTLSKHPSYPLEREYEDNIIRSDFEAGYQQTRPRFTRFRRRWKVRYPMLPALDMSTLESFQEGVMGSAGAFNWTSPEDETVYVVRFDRPIKFSYISLGYYSCEFTLVEV